MTFNDDDLYNWELCVWKESRGEGYEGMCAVAHVILNRVGTTGFPNTLHDVIYQKNAFTSMSVPTDPEYNLEPKDTDTQWHQCDAIIHAILNNNDPDITNGARYYANLKNVTSGWFSRNISGPDGKGLPGHELLATIGHQSFYK